MTSAEIRSGFSSSSSARAPPRAFLLSRSCGGPDAPLRQRGDEPVQGRLHRPREAGVQPRASAQKCVRAAGKHNDLDNVGYTARHHTFFEMLGNFSFGDYFKEDAIAFAWELLTAARRGTASSPSGSGRRSSPTTTRRRASGRRYLPEGEILRFGEKENFWAMGDTGPCGPCSEIHYFRGDDLSRQHDRRSSTGPAGRDRRDLEPRLHAVRARRVGEDDAAAEAVAWTPGWASSGSRRSSRARTTTTTRTSSGGSSRI